MQKYIGTKVLAATPMTRGEYNHHRGWQIPANEEPLDPGYLVEYEHGYQSWSPKAVFEAAYQSLDRMTFGHALEFLKLGRAVSRAGWNGKGMFVYLVPAASYPAQTGVAKLFWGEGALVPYRAYLALKDATGMVATWVPSITDLLADDWSVVSEN